MCSVGACQQVNVTGNFSEGLLAPWLFGGGGRCERCERLDSPLQVRRSSGNAALGPGAWLSAQFESLPHLLVGRCELFQVHNAVSRSSSPASATQLPRPCLLAQFNGAVNIH